MVTVAEEGKGSDIREVGSSWKGALWGCSYGWLLGRVWDFPGGAAISCLP